MSAHLVTPLQTFFQWLDERPVLRLLFTLLLVSIAIFATLPGWVLDMWLVCSLTGALGTAALLTFVGSELAPREVLAGLPAYLRRGFFHRMALAIALTKAIVTGHHPGVIMEWLAQGGLAGSVGVGLALSGALYVALFGLGTFFQAAGPGRASPELFAAARQIFALLRGQAFLGLALAVCLLSAGLLTGLLIKQWPLGLTLTSLTLYGLAEACLTATPALVVGGAMAHWLATAMETPDDEAAGENMPAQAPALLALEVGRELAPALRRAVPVQVAGLRTRLERELGLPLPRVALSVAPDLPPRMARVRLHGHPERWIELAEFDSLEAIAQLLASVARDRAGSLLTLDATRSRLDELASESPVLVAEAIARQGLSAIHGALKGLLRERASISDMAGVLEALVLAPAASSAAVLVEHARRGQSHALSLSVASDAGEITALELAPGWDEVLAGFSSWDTGLAADWSAGRLLAEACREAAATVPTPPVLLVPRRFRPLVVEILRAHGLDLTVLAPDELSSRFTLRLAGGVSRPAEATTR